MPREVTETDRLLLLLYYALDAEFQRIARSRVNIENWDPVNEAGEAAVWEALSKILQTGFGRVGSLVLRRELESTPTGRELLQSNPVVANILSWIDTYSLEMLNTTYAVNEVLQNFLDERHVWQGMRALNPEKDSVGTYLDTLSQTYRATRVTASDAVKLLDPDNDLPETTFERDLLGMEWLDKLMGGGPGICDPMLLIAPSGGGKTLIGTQMAWAKCMRGKYVDYFLYEQPIQGDISVRFYALAAKAARTFFDGKVPSQFEESVLRRLNEGRRLHGKYLRLHDYSEGEHGVNLLDDVLAAVDKGARAGEPSSLIIIDWAQAAVQKHMAFFNVKEDLLRHKMHEFGRSFRELCQTVNSQGLILQQMETKTAHVAGAEIYWNKSAECKSLAFFMRYVIGISRGNNEGVSTLFLSKATQAQTGSIPVRMRGEMNMFEGLVDESGRPEKTYDERSGQFGNV